MIQPKLSIILCGRNDSYGTNFIDRLKNSLSWNARLAEKYQLPTELLFIEYHPDAATPPISGLPVWPQNDFWTTRIISVLENDKSFKEFPAKNIGLRRADGEFILVTNADILFPESVFREFRRLQSDQLYRADRLNITKVLDNEAEMQRTATEYCVTGGIFSRPSWISHVVYYAFLPYYLQVRKLVYRVSRLMPKPEQFLLDYPFAGSGDFILAHRDLWMRLAGFVEHSPISTHVDSLFLLKTISHNIVIHEWDQPVLHQHHERRHDFSKPSKEMKEMWRILLDQIAAYLKAPHPIEDTGADWGKPQAQFPEQII